MNLNPFADPVIRLGVTGLSRSGKTVFITSLVANLLDRGRMLQFLAASQGRIKTAFLQPQPDQLVPRFEYENHLAAMTGANPHWPEGTRAISQLRVSLKIQPTGILSSLQNPRTVHIDIVDYPGEWLLDLPLLSQTYDEWSAGAIALAQSKARASQAEGWLAQLEACDPLAPLDEPTASAYAKNFTGYLRASREAGFSGCAPGRFLMPGDLEGSPALTFAPLPEGPAPRGSLRREFIRRFEAYKSGVIKPFYKNHFAKIDRQIVLVDALGALHTGPQTLGDLRDALADILISFRPGPNSWLSSILGKKVEKILFAATKADHLHHTQHPALTAIMQALVREAKDRADFAGATTHALSLAALRTTTETTRSHNGAELPLVQGLQSGTGKQVAMYAGELPADPSQVLNPAETGAQEWLDQDYQIMKFSPVANSLSVGAGPPHIRLDKAAEFLLGDKLR